MILLIDIGNTRAKYCLVSEGRRNTPKAVLTKKLTQQFLSDNFNEVSRLLVASVSHNEVTERISDWCILNKILYEQIISEKKKDNIISGYDFPRQLGVDRWLTLIGAAELFPNRNILIIDAGTATTVDFLLATGQHKGGWILAGIDTLVSSVLSQTAQVKANSINSGCTEFGLNTSNNVNNAAWAATVGMINLAISQIEKQGISVDEIIFTGGNGHLLSSFFSHQSSVIEELVFSGLQAYI
tara:strand:- start:114 stop:836 length:723 start_codon:yes stop_codon:yes gene_type:complete